MFIDYRYRYGHINHSSQCVDDHNNNIIDEDNDDHNHDVNFDLSTSEVTGTFTRISDILILVTGTGEIVNNDSEIITVPSDAVDNMHGQVLHSHIFEGPSSYDSHRSMWYVNSHDINNNESNNDHARRYDQNNNQILRRSDEYSDSNYHAIRHAIRSYDEARRRIEAIVHNDRRTN